jgi:uncharacterized protein YaiL (DUF2058 family)
MQDLRDKLLKAGLASKKEARKAKTEKRKERKQRGGAKAAAREQEKKKEQFERERAEQARADKARQEAINRQRAEKERENRILNLIRSHALLKIRGKDRPFYFMGKDRKIRRLVVSHALASKLSDGALAIAELRGDPERDFAVVDAATALRLEDLEAAGWILFWNKDQDELPAYGSGA